MKTKREKEKNKVTLIVNINVVLITTTVKLENSLFQHEKYISHLFLIISFSHAVITIKETQQLFKVVSYKENSRNKKRKWENEVSQTIS